MLFISTSRSRQAGFTLVEVAVITPIIILTALGILVLLTTLVRSSVSQTVRSNLASQQRTALSELEKDVNTSIIFFPGVLPSTIYVDYYEPSPGTTYKSNGTLPSGSSSSNLKTLLLQTYNQILDPQDTTKTKVIGAFKGTPPCSNGFTITTPDAIETVAIMYFVSNGTLYKRTLVDRTNPTLCNSSGRLIGQSCPTGSDGNTPQCTVKDVVLLSNVSEFLIDYYFNANDATTLNAYIASPSPTINQASAVQITLTQTSISAGKNVSHTSSIRMSQTSK